MLEGTGIYFLLLFAVFFIVYLTVKICLSKLFKERKIPAWQAFIPIYSTLILVDLLDIKRSVFYKTLIPIVNLYYYKIIIAELLKAYQLNPKEAIWFIIFPMYKFPELVFKNPKFMLHMYDDTEQFFVNQNSLYDSNNTTSNENQTPEIKIDPANYNQMASIDNPSNNLNTPLNSNNLNNQNNSQINIE